MNEYRIHQIKEHLDRGLALMDVVGHIEDLNALWRLDSVAYAMRLAWHEWKAAHDLLSDLEEDLQGLRCGGAPLPSTTAPGQESPAEKPRNGMPQP